MSSTTSVAVVGAGVTGLALSRELTRRGIDHHVYEADARPGGVIRSRRVEGRVLDLGPQRCRLVPPVRSLIRELDLEGEVLEAPDELPLYVYREGRLRPVPFSVAKFLATDLLTWRGKLRMLAEPLTGAGGEEETVARYVTRKLGREAYEYLVGPLYGGIYGSDPRRMLVRYSLGPALEHAGVSPDASLLLAGARWMLSGSETPPAASFREGMQALVDAMYAEASGRVSLEAPVRRVLAKDDGWALESEAMAMEASDVVFTCPADETARILTGVAPAAAARLGSFRYNRLAIVHMRSDCSVRGYGYQVALSERMSTRGVTFNDSLFDREGVYTAYLGGAGQDALVDVPDDTLEKIATREFEAVTGCPARPIQVSRTRMPAWDTSWRAHEGLVLPDGLHLCAAYVSRAGIPGRLAAAREMADELAGG